MEEAVCSNDTATKKEAKKKYKETVKHIRGEEEAEVHKMDDIINKLREAKVKEFVDGTKLKDLKAQVNRVQMSYSEASATATKLTKSSGGAAKAKKMHGGKIKELQARIKTATATYKKASLELKTVAGKRLTLVRQFSKTPFTDKAQRAKLTSLIAVASKKWDDVAKVVEKDRKALATLKADLKKTQAHLAASEADHKASSKGLADATAVATTKSALIKKLSVEITATEKAHVADQHAVKSLQAEYDKAFAALRKQYIFYIK